MYKLLFASTMLAAAFLLSSCSENANDPHDHDDDHDHETITEVVLVFAADGGTDTLSFVWEDDDGPGGNNPEIDTVKLSSNTLYNTQAMIMHHEEDLTPEIDSEADEHQFLWDIAGVSSTIASSDFDANNKMYGRRVQITIDESGMGTLTVELFHYDDPGDKVSGTPGDETDVQVVFPLVVE